MWKNQGLLFGSLEAEHMLLVESICMRRLLSDEASMHGGDGVEVGTRRRRWDGTRRRRWDGTRRRRWDGSFRFGGSFLGSSFRF